MFLNISDIFFIPKMKFLSIQNLSAAYKNALKSRKRKKEVYDFNINLEKNLISILDDLKHKTYQH
jgi:hypothetical protein